MYKLKTDLFSSWLFTEKRARWVIWKHPKTEAHAFYTVKQNEKELLIIDGLTKENTYPIAQSNTNTTSPNGAQCIIPSLKIWQNVEYN